MQGILALPAFRAAKSWAMPLTAIFQLKEALLMFAASIIVVGTMEVAAKFSRGTKAERAL